MKNITFKKKKLQKNEKSLNTKNIVCLSLCVPMVFIFPCLFIPISQTLVSSQHSLLSSPRIKCAKLCHN